MTDRSLLVEEGTQHKLILGSPLTKLIDVMRPGESCIKRHTPISGCVNPFDWFPEQCYYSGLNEGPSGTSEYFHFLIDTLIAILHSVNHR
jgi:hypothetical protein